MEQSRFAGVAFSGRDQVMVAIDDVCGCKGIFSIHVFGNYNHIELRSNPLRVVLQDLIKIIKNFVLMNSILSTTALLFCLTSLSLAFQIRQLQSNAVNPISLSPYTSEQVFQLLNWKKNDDLIQKMNQEPSLTFKVQHNHFSFFTFQEIQQMYLTLHVATPPTVVGNNQVPLQVGNQMGFPTTQMIMTAFGSTVSVDWRTKGFVTQVKNQGPCGACWAFAATAQIQSYLLMKSNLKVSLSSQQLIDCSQLYGNIGCYGGMMDNAFKYTINQGITTESIYPYKGSTSTCQYKKSTSLESYSIKQSKIIYSDCSALTQLLKQQPTTVVVSVNIAFIFYSQGILNSCGSQINHAIQLVGYYKDSNKAYYIGKNSWGRSWGQQGFINIDANLQNGNLCNVCAYPQYVQ